MPALFCRDKMLRIIRAYSNVTIRTQLQEQLKLSMKARDKITTGVVKSCISDILVAEKSGKPFEVSQILQKAVSRRLDSISIFEQNGRLDLASIEKGELAILSRFLPKQKTREEICKVLSEIINSIESPDIGKLMKAANAQLDVSVAPRSVVSGIARQLLNKNP